MHNQLFLSKFKLFGTQVISGSYITYVWESYKELFTCNKHPLRRHVANPRITCSHFCFFRILFPELRLVLQLGCLLLVWRPGILNICWWKQNLLFLWRIMRTQNCGQPWKSLIRRSIDEKDGAATGTARDIDLRNKSSRKYMFWINVLEWNCCILLKGYR